MGWQLTSYAWAVKSVATRAAALSRYPQSDIANRVIQVVTVENSWTVRAASLLSYWGLPCYASWEATGASLESYKSHVQEHLAVWCSSQLAVRVAQHGGQVAQRGGCIQYGTFQRGTSTALPAALDESFPWDVLIATRSWSRLRIGLLVFSHRNRHVSREKSKAVYSAIAARKMHCSNSLLRVSIGKLGGIP